jgi:hypothetical protein
MKTIEHEGKTYHQVGCRKCGSGERLCLYHDGEKPLIRCDCGHIIELDKPPKTEPDPQPISMRFLT